jgi:hypothetical protein
MYIDDNRIDLTENTDFRKQPERNAISVYGKRKEIIGIAEDLEDFGGIYPYYTGSAEMIRVYMLYLKTYDKCIRCGCILMPWEQQEVCSDCDRELDDSYGSRYPWENTNLRERVNNMFFNESE